MADKPMEKQHAVQCAKRTKDQQQAGKDRPAIHKRGSEEATRREGGLQLGAAPTSKQAQEQKPAKGEIEGEGGAATNRNHNSVVEGPRGNSARPNVET
jgi:hypothetical protein